MRRERGVAAITAILIVAVAASAAAVMLSQQSAMLDQSMLVVSRAQADLYAQAGIDWARGVLAEDAQSSAIDSLKEGWAQPIVGLPVERAVVAGDIADEQGKLNLNNLLKNTQRSDADMKAFGRLLSSLGLAPELAEAVLDWIDADSDLSGGGGAEDAYYLSLAKPYRTPNVPMTQVEELYRVRGFDAAAVAKLKPYVTALPARTPLNVNTASDRVLAAVLDIANDKAAQLVAERNDRPFGSTQDFTQRAGKMGLTTLPQDLAVSSQFFSTRVQVAQDDVQLSVEALLQREPAPRNATAIIWRRPRY
ncbi:MAG TPA: type II secretion system minor pseudopilin GspK [Usitatibacter sp.]|nr:type II secretion system minor pseudopilin GspK [Usitatibacter sp.]